MNLRGNTAIVGIGESELGEAPSGTRPQDLMVQASVRALRDAGLKPSDVDGVFAAAGQLLMAPLYLAQDLGMTPRYIDGTNIGGSSFMAHVNHARAAIAAGLCKVAVVAYGSTARLDRASSAPEVDPWEKPYRAIEPLASYAFAASRHMHDFGTTREQLASVAVAARRWAQLTPGAWDQDDLALEDVLGARLVSDPLTVRDCCLVTDGGAAVVMTSADVAKGLPHAPAYVLGAGESSAHMFISGMPDLTRTPAVASGLQAFDEARLKPSDVDVVQLYDAFTITPLLFLEDLGFVDKGQSGAFVADGNTLPGGSLPMNTNGGGMSYGHPGMYGLFGLVEAVRQLRGREGERQVENANVALAHGNGGLLSSEATVLLGTESVL
ncbi:acetyl-CoA acetyltransferase [Citricoccus sp. NPDC055426]|uniref:acetyl-CoA acetyltransferase n=1 Tax=Citricoccus sp. NPDC055426 TaxID=3155536 RepID=UPI00343E5593